MVKKLERGEEAGRPAFAVPRCGLAFTSLSRIEFSLTPRLDSTILGGEFQKMQWPRLLAYITGRVDKELLVRNEYLAAENRILRAKIKSRLQLSDGEKRTWPKSPTGWDARHWPKWRWRQSPIPFCAGFVSWWRASLMDRPAGNRLGGRGLRRRSRI